MIPGAQAVTPVNIYQKAGDTAYGPTLATTPITIRAYIEPSRRRVVNSKGQTVQCDLFLAFSAPGVVVKPGDEAELDGQRYIIEQVDYAKAWGRTHHIEAALRSVVS